MELTDQEIMKFVQNQVVNYPYCKIFSNFEDFISNQLPSRSRSKTYIRMWCKRNGERILQKLENDLDELESFGKMLPSYFSDQDAKKSSPQEISVEDLSDKRLLTYYRHKADLLEYQFTVSSIAFFKLYLAVLSQMLKMHKHPADLLDIDSKEFLKYYKSLQKTRLKTGEARRQRTSKRRANDLAILKKIFDIKKTKLQQGYSHRNVVHKSLIEFCIIRDIFKKEIDPALKKLHSEKKEENKAIIACLLELKNIFEEFAPQERELCKELKIQNITQLPPDVFFEIVILNNNRYNADCIYNQYPDKKYHKIIEWADRRLDCVSCFLRHRELNKFINVVLRKVRQNLDTASITKKKSNGENSEEAVDKDFFERMRPELQME